MTTSTSLDDLTFSTLTRDDIEVLRLFARDVSRAREPTDWRRLGRLIGVGLLLLGVILAMAGTFVQLALALPLSEIHARPAVIAGMATVCAGLVVLALAAICSRKDNRDRDHNQDERADRVYRQIQSILDAAQGRASQAPPRHGRTAPADRRAGLTTILGLARS